ncbi:MAG: phosphatase PAP2 family protein [bacterium]
MKYILYTVLSLFGFLATYFLVRGGYFLPIDHFFVSLPHTTWLTWLFFIITDVGGLACVILGSLLLVLFLVVENHYKEALCTTFALSFGVVSQTIVKYLLAVERPSASLVSTVGYSFPSGHANMATILFLSAYLYLFHKFASIKKQKILFFLCAGAAFMIGISRVYLNAHWASDVVAGWFFGIFWATLPLSFLSLKKRFTI